MPAIFLLEVVRALDRAERRHGDRESAALPRDVDLGRELQRLVESGSINAGLQVARDADSVFEPDCRSLVEAEQVPASAPKSSRRRLPLKRCVSSKFEPWTGGLSVDGKFSTRKPGSAGTGAARFSTLRAVASWAAATAAARTKSTLVAMFMQRPLSVGMNGVSGAPVEEPGGFMAGHCTELGEFCLRSLISDGADGRGNDVQCAQADRHPQAHFDARRQQHGAVRTDAAEQHVHGTGEVAAALEAHISAVDHDDAIQRVPGYSPEVASGPATRAAAHS